MFQIRDQILNSPYILNNLGSFGYVCWVEFPFHVLLLSSSSSLLWSWWIPDETPPRTLWCTPQLPCKKKQQERLACNLSKEGVQVLILILFLASPNSQKKIILLTENSNLKHETNSFCLWNLQIVIIEYFVQSHQWKNMCIFKHSKVV